MRLTFDIEHSGELAAGIHGYTERVVIDVESGCPGGEPGEFQEEIHNFLAEWFDGASVTLCTAPEPQDVQTPEGDRVKGTGKQEDV